MKKQIRYSPEVRERAVRLLREHRGEYASEWAALESIASKKLFGNSCFKPVSST